MTESTERLISGLVDGLEPVAPLPRLRSAFCAVWVAWAILSGLILWSQPGAPSLTELSSDRFYWMSFLGLLAAAFGGTVSALASGQPGRARSEAIGLGICTAGLLIAATACLLGLSAGGVPAASSTVASWTAADVMCFRRGALLSLLPAGVMLSFLARGWTSHPMRAALMAAAAAGALGAATFQLSCGVLDASHWLKGHLAVPIMLSIVLVYPLALLLRRWRG